MITRHISIILFTLGLLIVFAQRIDYKQTFQRTTVSATVEESQQTFCTLVFMTSGKVVDKTTSSIQQEDDGFQPTNTDNSYTLIVMALVFTFVVLIVSIILVSRAQSRVSKLGKQLNDLVAGQKLLHHELEASQNRFKNLLDASSDAMVIISDKGRIVMINRQTEYLFGYTPDELVGNNIEVLFSMSDKNWFVAEGSALLKSPTSEKQPMAIALQALKKNGSVLPVEISMATVSSSDAPMLSVSMRDVSSNREAEERVMAANRDLQKANEALKKINEELSDFSYSISHDLRAPLRAINGYSALLREDYASKLDENGNRVLGVIQRNAQRMDELINDLLELAKLGSKTVSKQKVNMRNIVDAVLSDKAIKEGTRITIDSMEEAWGDPSLLRQVWENLVSNALKFSSTTPTPEIQIRYKREGEMQFFSVSDNGVGFDPAYSDKLFKVFSRLHAKHEFEGTGAGLAICRKIIEAHGGTISGCGKLKQGAEFTFSLPTVDDIS